MQGVTDSRDQTKTDTMSGPEDTRHDAGREPGPVVAGIAPIVPVRSILGSLAFYRDRLGFEVIDQNAEQTSALVAREGARLLLLRVADREALIATERHLSAYVWVKGVDRLYAELAPRLADLPEDRVDAPHDEDYGMREFRVKDPDGFLLFFAEAAHSGH